MPPVGGRPFFFFEASRYGSAGHRVKLSAQHPRLSSRLPWVCSRPDAILCCSFRWSRPPPCGMGTVWCGSLNCVPLRMCVCICICTHEHTPLSSWCFLRPSTIGHSHFFIICFYARTPHTLKKNACTNTSDCKINE